MQYMPRDAMPCSYTSCGRRAARSAEEGLIMHFLVRKSNDCACAYFVEALAFAGVMKPSLRMYIGYVPLPYEMCLRPYLRSVMLPTQNMSSLRHQKNKDLLEPHFGVKTGTFGVKTGQIYMKISLHTNKTVFTPKRTCFRFFRHDMSSSHQWYET